MMHRVALGMLAAALSACGTPSDDRIETISKLKILAVRAAEPDIYPGQTTRVDVLVGAPGAMSMTTFVMPFAQQVVSDYGRGEAEFGAAGVTFGFIPGTTVPTLPLSAGVGIAGAHVPGSASAYYQAPATPGSYTLGVFVRPGVPAVSPTASRAELEAKLRTEMQTALKAFKVVRVKAPGEPLNKNPDVHGLVPERRWAGVEQGAKTGNLAPDGFRVEPGQVIRLRVDFDDEHPERPSTVWWITGGTVDGYGRNDIDWVAPESAGIQTLVALTLDREGGADWYEQDVAVGPRQIKPDATYTGRDRHLLALSGGRMVWLGFADAASTAAIEKNLAVGNAVIVGGRTDRSSATRLGWSLAAPEFVGIAADVTEPVNTAGEFGRPITQGASVLLRLDGLVHVRE